MRSSEPSRSLKVRAACLAFNLVWLTHLHDVRAATQVVDDFDGNGIGVDTRVINPASGTFNTSGRLFDIGNRASTLPNRTAPNNGLPFTISDDSVVAAAGNAVAPTDTAGIFGQNKFDSFLGVVDTNDPGNPNNNLGVVTWTLNTSGLSNLQLQVDVGAMGDFESIAPADFASFDVSFNGGANFTPVMLFRADESVTITYRQLDKQLADGMGASTGLNDPMAYFGPNGILGGGDDFFLDKSNPTTGALDTLTAPIPGTGASMILRFQAFIEGVAEAFAIDNVTLIDVAGGGDFDGDGDVDGRDIIVWQRGVGSPNPPSSTDLANWQANYGLPDEVEELQIVAEPTSAALVVVAVGVFGRRRPAVSNQPTATTRSPDDR